MRTGVPCNENRFFPVRIYYTGKTLYWPCTRLQCMSLNLMSLNQDCTVFATHFLTKFRNQLLTNISDHKCNPVKSRCNLEYFPSFFLPRARILCVKIWFKNSVVFTMPWPRRKSEVGGRQTFFPAFNVGVVIFHHVYQQIVGFHLHFF